MELNPTELDQQADMNFDDGDISGDAGMHGLIASPPPSVVQEIPAPPDDQPPPDVNAESITITPCSAVQGDAGQGATTVSPGSTDLAGSEPQLRVDRETATIGGKVTVDVSHGDLARMTDEVNSVLIAADEFTQIYRQGSVAVRVCTNDDGSMSIAPLTSNVLRSIAAELIHFYKKTDKGDVRVLPLKDVMQNILSHPDKPFPPLDCVATAPFVTQDRRLALTSRYYPESRILLSLRPVEENLSVPENPTNSEIQESVHTILDDWLGDFPFVGDPDKAHVILFAIAPMIRPVIIGPTPLFLINKAAAGTGAGLMLEVLSLVSLGGPVAIMTEGSSDSETKKQITSKLRTGPRLIVHDNVQRPLDSSSHAAAITSNTWEDRVLGTSSMTRVSTAMVTWCATGINVRTSVENSLRVVQIEMDAKMNQPWMRQNFRHKDLVRWSKDNLSMLRRACLTIIQAWISRGCPIAPGQPRLGSFESWSDVAGGILHVAGVPGFLTNMDRLCKAADPQGSAIAAFATLWWSAHQSEPVGAARLIGLAREAEMDLGHGSDRAVSTRFGISLREMAGKLYQTTDGTALTVTAAGDDTGAKLWSLIPVGGGPSAATPPIQGGGES